MKKRYIVIYLSVMAIIVCSLLAIITIELNKVNIGHIGKIDIGKFNIVNSKKSETISIATDINIETDSNNVFKNKVDLNDFIIKDKELENNALYPYKGSNNLVGYINDKGEVVIEAKYEDGDNFSEGLAAIQLRGKWGYIDQSGKIVIDPQYDFTSLFKNDLAEVGFFGKSFKDDKAIVINKNNKKIIEEEGVYADTSNNGYIVLNDGKENRYYDLSGKELEALEKYDIYDGFYGDYIWGYNSEKSCLLNRKIEEIKFKDLTLQSFDHGVIELYHEEGPNIYLNSKLKPLYLKEQYRSLTLFPKGDQIAVVSGSEEDGFYYTYINYDGEKLFSSNCIINTPFIDGVAVAYNLDNDENCVINDKGEILTEGDEEISIANKDLIIVGNDNDNLKYGVKRISGDYVVKPVYDSITNYNNCFICEKDDEVNKTYEIYNISGQKIQLNKIVSFDYIDNTMLSIKNDLGEIEYYLNTNTGDVIPYKR